MAETFKAIISRFGKQALSIFPVNKKNSIKKKGTCKVDLSGKKIFCIGLNKTGTTSLESALKDLGIKMGNQAVAEMLAEDWAHKRTDRIIRYCHTADAFQDLPFSTPGLFKELDKAFPGSLFILTVRDNEDQWYRSLVNFHSKQFSADGKVPDQHDLENAMYRYKGFLLDMRRNFWGFPDVPLYDESYYKKIYIDHIEDVLNHFSGREEDLLVLNVANSECYEKLCKYLGVTEPHNSRFPWMNKTN